MRGERERGVMVREKGEGKTMVIGEGMEGSL